MAAFTWSRRSGCLREGSRAIHTRFQSRQLLLVAAGVIKISCTLPNGDQVSPGLRYPGQFVEEYAPLTNRPHTVSAIAVTNCTVYCIAAERMRDLLQTNLEANRLFLPTLLNDLYRQTVATVECDALTAPDRCVRLLRELARVLGALRPDTWVPLPLTEGELGELLGVTETHVGRLMTEPLTCGLLRREGRRWLLRTKS